MISIEDVRRYIEENEVAINGTAQIGDETVRFIHTNEGFHRRFCMPPNVTDPYHEDRIVFVSPRIDFSQFVEKPGLVSEVLIEDAFVLGDVQFNGVVFDKDFSLTVEGSSDASLSFTNCRFMGKLKIRNKEHNNYEEDCKTKAKLKSIEFTDCSIDGQSVNYIRFGFLDVENFVIKNLKVPNSVEVNIGDCHFKNFRLSKFRNSGKFKLYKINVKEKKNSNDTFQIDNTSIGDTDFQRLNLVSFKTRKIFDNILSGINYTNIQWEEPDTDIEVGKFDAEDEITIRAQKRDTYRVLKNVAQKNNDMPQAFAFYAKEMKWHRELLKKTAKVKFCTLFKPKELSKLLDRFTLWFGAVTSNYGQNWLFPILWIFGLGAVFYAALLWVLPGDVCNCENWAKFPLFLNPTHKVEFIGGWRWGFWAYFLDILFRALEGALIYQSIQAFRKYSRSF